MTNAARDLVEIGNSAATGAENKWRASFVVRGPARTGMMVRATLIATFRKLAEDGPTEAMLVAALAAAMQTSEVEVWRFYPRSDFASMRRALKAANECLLRELEGLTP